MVSPPLSLPHNPSNHSLLLRILFVFFTIKLTKCPIGVTPKAVIHRIARVRGLPASAAGGDENGPSTPKKAKKVKAAMTPKGTTGGKKRAARNFEDEDENEGLGQESPKSAKKVKVED